MISNETKAPDEKANRRISDWGIRVKHELVDRHMTTGELADAIDYKRSYVSAVINGIVNSPHVIEKINIFFGWGDGQTSTT